MKKPLTKEEIQKAWDQCCEGGPSDTLWMCAGCGRPTTGAVVKDGFPYCKRCGECL